MSAARAAALLTAAAVLVPGAAHAAEVAAYEEAIDTPGDYDAFLAYSNATIPNQLAFQNVRGLELDLFGDPAGGLYAEPLIRRAVGTGPLPDPAWREPGINVFHIADFDHRTTCVQFTTCLEQVRSWSDANPDHVSLLIMLELKRSDDRAVAAGGVVAPAWDAAALDGLDAEIRSLFSDDDMITPDDVGRPGLTLEESVRRHGWPALAEARGQVAFLLDNEPGVIRDACRAGRPSLEGRVLFMNAVEGDADAAFLKRNDPLGMRTAEIQRLVRQGYLVRTRSDIPLRTVRENDTTMLDAALASGRAPRLDRLPRGRHERAPRQRLRRAAAGRRPGALQSRDRPPRMHGQAAGAGR